MNQNLPPALALRDIHLPDAPTWWPPAPGWWLVGALLLALGIRAGVVALRRWRRRRERQRVLFELARLETGLAHACSPELLSRVSVLLRRLALMRFPRTQVAALTGSAWLHFLDASGGGSGFTQGPGQVLAAGPYQSSLPPDLDTVALIALVREWIGKKSGSPP